MAVYQTGTATGVADLLDKIVAFAIANGWTQDSYATDGTGKRAHLHKNGNYVNLRSHIAEALDSNVAGAGGVFTGIVGNFGTGYNGASAWYNQAGVPQGTVSKYMVTGMKITGAVPAYHAFANGDCLYVWVEYTAGKYQFIAFGALDKIGSYTGGAFFTGSVGQNTIENASIDVSSGNWNLGQGFLSAAYSSPQGNGFVNCTVDAEAGWKWGFNNTRNRPSTVRYCQDNLFIMQYLMNQTPSLYNNIAVIHPLQAYVFRDTSNSRTSSPFSPIGYIPGVFFVNMTFLTPGQQITLGSDTYRVFPLYTKAATGPREDSSYDNGTLYGYAVRSN